MFYVISVRCRPFHGWRGTYDWLSAPTLHEVVLVLHHTICLCGKCCSVFLCYVLLVANSWHFCMHIGSVPVPRGELQAPDLQHSVHIPLVGWSAWLGIGPVVHAMYPTHCSLQVTALQRIIAGGQYACVHARTHSLVHVCLFVTVHKSIGMCFHRYCHAFPVCYSFLFKKGLIICRIKSST